MLFDLTTQRTVPNIFVAGDHLGGCDKLLGEFDNGLLFKRFEENNISYSKL